MNPKIDQIHVMIKLTFHKNANTNKLLLNAVLSGALGFPKDTPFKNELMDFNFMGIIKLKCANDHIHV